MAGAHGSIIPAEIVAQAARARTLGGLQPLVDAAQAPAEHDQQDPEGDREAADDPHDRERTGRREQEQQ